MDDELLEVLTGPVVEIDYGVDLLDNEDNFVADISEDVTALEVQHDLHADVHGTCRLELTRDLRWGVDRVRPWLSVWDGQTRLRWPLGVYLLTTPETSAGEEPRTRPVDGMNKLWLLQREVGDTYVLASGQSYLDAVRKVLTDAGVTGAVLLQGDRQDTLLAEDAVWPLLDNGYTWLDIVNGFLGMIGYRGLWADEEGRFRSAPTTDARTQPAKWVFDAGDALAGVVGEGRTLSTDVWGLPNYWKFVRNKDRALTADDTYIVDHTTGLPREQFRPRTVYLDVADRAALEAEGNRIVAEDTATEKVATLDLTSPLPFGHGDVVELRDPGLSLPSARGVLRYWRVNHTGEASVDVEIV